MNELHDDQPCPHCGRYNNRGVSIDAVIIEDGKVLLIKRGVDPYKGFWATPGGFVHWDESAEERVTKEVGEETGLVVKRARFVSVNTSPNRHPRQVINLVYLVETERGKPIAGDDASDTQWFSLDALPEQMAFDHKQNIADAQQFLAAN